MNAQHKPSIWMAVAVLLAVASGRVPGTWAEDAKPEGTSFARLLVKAVTAAGDEESDAAALTENSRPHTSRRKSSRSSPRAIRREVR